MRMFAVLFVMAFFASCAQNDKVILKETPFQKKKNAEFKDATTSPLKEKDLKRFEGLDFFPYDSSFVVKTTLTRTPDSEWFNMKTTTNRVSKERVYGILNFEMNGKTFELNVYQGQDLMQTPGFEDYLFLPFLDNTNGESTYAGGRYIDLTVPEGDTVVVDFNSAYNPNCVYNEKYSCPIVPRVNYLDMEVEAGVKMFKK